MAYIVPKYMLGKSLKSRMCSIVVQADVQVYKSSSTLPPPTYTGADCVYVKLQQKYQEL